MFTGQNGAVRLSALVVISLIVLKTVIGILTGSLSVIAQAVDSFLDLFAVGVTFLAVHIAAKPADKEHPFGHGKAENIAAIIQAILIFFAGGSIIYSSVSRAGVEAPLEMTEAGIAVMVVSVIASILLSRHLRKVARQEDSMALEANAHNIAVDVYSAAAVLVGLVIVRITGVDIIDDILAGLVALLILKTGIDVLRKSFTGLIDVKLPENEEKLIELAISEHFGDQVIEYHKLRTRKSGSQRYVDLHLVMPRHISLEEAHVMCDHLENDMKQRLMQMDITIHVEPCDGKCERCPLLPCRGRLKQKKD
jgi:cation diffusion facilitator family transporter